MTATRTWTAAAWMAGAIASFSLLAVGARAVSPPLDTFEIMLFRSALGLVAVVVLMLAMGRLAEARPRRLGTHAVRNVLHFAGQNLWFYALTVLPLAQVFALEFTAPIWVILLAPLLLGERLTPRALIGAAVGFAGILVVARPDFGSLHPGLVAAALCAVCFATTSLITKRLTRTQSVLAILLWLNLFQLVFSILIVGWDGTVTWPTAEQVPWLVAIGVFGLSAHWCLTSALEVAPASIVMPLDFARLPVIAVVGWAAYGEALDWFVLAGAVLILAGNLLTSRSAASREPPVAP